MPEVTGTTNTKQERVTQVIAWLGEHKRYCEIVSQGVTYWGVSDRTVKRDIAEAYREIGTQARAQRARYLGDAIVSLTRLRSKAEADRDYRTAISAQAELDKLLGLNAPLQVEDVTDKARPMHDWADNRLTARLAELRGNGGAGPH